MKEKSFFILRPSLLSVFILFLILGFLFGAQIRLQQRAKPLREMSESDLSQLVYQISLENDALRRQLYQLEIRLLDYEKKETTQKEILKQALADLERISVLSGLKGITGEGIELKIEDEKGILKTIDLLDLINEIKSAGAEAIAVNGVRLSARSFLALNNSVLIVDGRKLNLPIEIKALGDPHSLEGALVLPGGVVQTLSALEGVKITLIRKKKITLPAAVLLGYNYARFD